MTIMMKATIGSIAKPRRPTWLFASIRRTTAALRFSLASPIRGMSLSTLRSRFREWSDRTKRRAVRTLVGALAGLGVLELTTHLPSQGRSSEIYHKVSDDWATPALRTFLDPEVAHNAAIFFARHGLAPRCRPPTSAEQRANLKMNLWGLEFASPIGLAAGFDKNGTVVQEMIDLGFDFVEVGTVTPRPQSGNPERPRMWRIPLEKAIVNRYGFNNAGSQAVRDNLEQYRSEHRSKDEPKSKQEAKKTAVPGSGSTAATPAPEAESLLSKYARLALGSLFRLATSYPHRSGVVGVSLGKNRDTPDADAVRDYVAGMEALGPLADFVVVNVSSPNTAGLREWQELSRLENLLRSVVAARMRLGLQHSTPLLVKLSPDLEHDQLADIGKLCLRLGIDGIVMSNTTTLSSAGDYVRWKLDHPQGSELGGGLSGAPLLEKSTEGIRVLFRATQGRIPIVGVGGIMTARDCVQKLKAGASLVQIYSGMVYQGPGMVSKLRRDLAQAVLDEGVRSAEELVGMDHEDLYWARQQEKVAVQRRFHSRVVAVAGTAGAGGASAVPAAASAAAAAGLVAGVPPVGAGAVAAAAVPTTKGFPGPGAGSPAAPPSAAPVGTMAQAGSAPAAASGALPAVPPQQQATQPRPKNYRHL